jgi:hypothetical protein
MGKDIDRGLFELDYKAAAELSVEMFAWSTAEFPEAWWPLVSPRSIKIATAWALHTRRVLEGLRVLGADVPPRGKFDISIGSDASAEGIEYESCLHFSVNRIAHAVTCEAFWDSTGPPNPKTGSHVASLFALKIATDHHGTKLVYLPALAIAFLTKVRALVFETAPWATLDGSHLETEQRDGEWYLIGGKLSR